jgi:DNA-binding response OmpR family regulator
MRVLVVEGSTERADALARGLERHGHEVESVSSAAAALASHENTDLVLLHLDLPDIDGLELCRRIRGTDEKPVIAFTGRATELDRVLALQAGADDCLDSPFEFRELMARIEAVTRRLWPGGTAKEEWRTVVSQGSLRIDAASREVAVRGREISLTRREFDLLYYLARHSDTVVSRQRLMEEIWDDARSHVQDPRASRTIDTHVSSLRSKLGCSDWIRTVRGVGFRIGTV